MSCLKCQVLLTIKKVVVHLFDKCQLSFELVKLKVFIDITN